MGLDLLDVKFRIERDLHLEVSQEEFVGLLRDRDIIVGDLYELILKKLHLRDVGRHSVRLNSFLWSEMRSAIHSATNVPLERIELGTALEPLFPRKSRRGDWEALREACPYKIRGLDYSRFVRFGGFGLAAGVVVIEQFRIWQIPGAKWFWWVLGAIGVWMVGETYTKLLVIFAPFRRHFPAGLKTVKDLCRSVMSLNYSEICKGTEMQLDDRCTAIWEQLVEILVSTLGVDAGEITFRSRLFADLGAS